MTRYTASHQAPSLSSALSWALVAVWVLFVWSRSTYAGDASSGQSLFVVDLLRAPLDAFGLRDVELANHVVRKLGHFSEYAVLGLLLRTTWRGNKPGVTCGPSWRWPLAQVAVALLVPSIDETIQLVVPGRTGMVTDVLIDLSGAVVGCLVATAAICLARRLCHR